MKTSPDPLELTIFFPVYKDEKTVKAVTEKALSFLQAHASKGEVLIIDDGSPDRSGEIADELAARHASVRVIHHTQNKGYGEALKTGFREARYEWIGFTDGDDEYDVFDLERLLKHRRYYDLIITFRYVKMYSTSRVFISWVYNRAVRLLFGAPYRDISTGLRAVRRSLIQELSLEATSPFIGAEIAIKSMLHGYRVGEVGIQTFPRKFGRGATVTPRNILATIKDMLRIRRTIFSPHYELPEERPRASARSEAITVAPNPRPAVRSDLEVERQYFDRLVVESGEFNPLSDRAWGVFADLFAGAVSDRRSLSVLDVGCGTGRSRIAYASRARSYVGLDLSLNALRVAKLHRPAERWLQGDALALPFDDERFDVVAFSSILHHLTDRRAALREALRVLQPGGRIFAFDPNLLHPAMACFRHPSSPLYISHGVSPLERPLLGRTLREDFAAAGCADVTQRARSGFHYRAVAPPLLNKGLAIYNVCDTLLQWSGLGRWLGAFVVTVGAKPQAEPLASG